MLTVADALVCALREFGVRYLFGVSGANIEHVHDSVYRHGQQKLHSILCKSEMGAAFMADGYARHSGRIGVCCATSGGGAMNLSVGVAEARASGVPVLALVGCPPAILQGRGAFQQAEGGMHQVDGEQLWRSVAKQVAVLDAEKFWSTLHSTLVAMLSGHPGPAVLLIHRDTMEAPVAPLPDDNWTRFFASVWRAVDESRCEPATPYMAFEKAWRSAERPVVIAGAAVALNPHLVVWAEREQVPVATTLEAPSTFPQTHPQFLGLVGVAGHASCHAYIAHSDAVLVLGCNLDIMARAPVEKVLQDKPVCLVHTNLQAIPDWPQLTPVEDCPKRWLTRSYLDTEENAAFRARDWAEPMPFERQVVEASPAAPKGLGNTQAAEALQPFLPLFGTVMMDAGNCAATAAHHLRFPAAVRSQIALGMGGMGYAVCAGIGAQLARPDQYTMVLCGDGAMLMLGTELHTAIEMGLPMLWVVFNDSQHGMCTTRQRTMFGGRINTTRYSSVDFTTMVRGLAGKNPVWLAQADTADAVTQGLDEYLSLGTGMPGVLELLITEEEIPPFYPLMSVESPTRERHRAQRVLAT